MRARSITDANARWEAQSQWSPPRFAKARGSYDRCQCGRRRVGEVGEDRSRLTVEQNVFSRALGATPFKGGSASQAVRHQCCVFSREFDLTIVVAARTQRRNAAHLSLHEEFGGRRPCLVQPDRTGCLHPPHKHGLKLENYVLLYRAIRVSRSRSRGPAQGPSSLSVLIVMCSSFFVPI